MRGETTSTASELIAWAAPCRAAAEPEPNADAEAAYQALAGEFEAVESEIEGLVDSFEALKARRVGPQQTAA